MSTSTELEPTSAAAVPTPFAGKFFPHPHGGEPIRGDLYGVEHLEAHARHLAAATVLAPVVPGRPLLRHFTTNGKALVRAHREISEAYRRRECVDADAEWLLDNFH